MPIHACAPAESEGTDAPRPPWRPAGGGQGPRPSRRGLLGAAGALLGAACAPRWPSVDLRWTLATPTAAPEAAPTATPEPMGPVLPVPARTLGGRLLFVSDANIWLVEQGHARRLTDDRISRQPSWSRDGQKIALVKVYTSGSDLWMMDPDGGNSAELTDFSYREERLQSYAWHPLWLPDGTALLYLSEQGSQDQQLWRLTLADRRRQRALAPAGDGLGGLDVPKLSPDGRTLAVASFQAGRGPANRSQIWTWTFPNGPWQQVTDAPEGAYDPDWSPDGQRLAYVVRRAGRHDVWVAGADGRGARQVTTAGVCRAPAWSPDGTTVAYLSAQGGTFDVWLVPVAPPLPPEAPEPTAEPGVASGAAGPAQPLTRGGLLDAASGIAWAP
ncbi:MAG TPA: hypothetical protein VHS99_00735 [Chloroflexota bacterium]|nr:hypothetical protein [Chloroflexota bacterium]